MDVVDDKTVADHARSAPDGAFLDNLAMFVASIVPKAVVETMGDEEFSLEPGRLRPVHAQRAGHAVSAIELERNPNYWRAPMPYLDGVDDRRSSRTTTRASCGSRTARPTLAEDVPYAQVERIDALDGVSVASEHVFKWDAIWLNTRDPAARRRQRPPGAQLRDRRRRTILENILFGRGDDRQPHHRQRQVLGRDACRPTRTTSTRRRSSWPRRRCPDGFTLTILIAAGDSVGAAMAEVIKEAWAEIGVERPARAGRHRHAPSGRWLGDDPVATMSATFPGSALSTRHAVGRQPASSCSSSPTRASARSARTTTTPRSCSSSATANATLRRGCAGTRFAQAQALAMADAPAVPLFFTNARTAVADNVQGFHTYKIGWWHL